MHYRLLQLSRVARARPVPHSAKGSEGGKQTCSKWDHAAAAKMAIKFLPGYGHLRVEATKNQIKRGNAGQPWWLPLRSCCVALQGGRMGGTRGEARRHHASVQKYVILPIRYDAICAPYVYLYTAARSARW